MHNQHEIFAQGVKDGKKIELTFFTEEDLVKVVKICAPIDYNPGRRATDESSLYYFLSFEDDNSCYALSLSPNQIINMKLTEDSFDPEYIIDYDTRWFLERRRGALEKTRTLLKQCLSLGGKSNPKQGADRRGR